MNCQTSSEACGNLEEHQVTRGDLSQVHTCMLPSYQSIQ